MRTQDLHSWTNIKLYNTFRGKESERGLKKTENSLRQEGQTNSASKFLFIVSEICRERKAL